MSWRLKSPTTKRSTYISQHHDDVIEWKHFPRYWPFVRGNHRPLVNSPHKGQWRGHLMFSLICARIDGWVNNGEAGDLRRYRTHYDVIVMTSQSGIYNKIHGYIRSNNDKIYHTMKRRIVCFRTRYNHYIDVIMSAMASQITVVSIACSTVYPGADQTKHQSSASLAFVGGNSPVTGEFPSQRSSNTPVTQDGDLAAICKISQIAADHRWVVVKSHRAPWQRCRSQYGLQGRRGRRQVLSMLKTSAVRSPRK